MSRPKNIAGTTRQRVVTVSGAVLERSYIYLLPEIWKLLYALSAKEGISESRYLSQLIQSAAEDGEANNKDLESNDSNNSSV